MGGNVWLIRILLILVAFVAIKISLTYYDGVKKLVTNQKVIEDVKEYVVETTEEKKKVDPLVPAEPVEKPIEAVENVEKNESDVGVDLGCEKWIIITSISDPTEHVRYLRDALVDWCLIVAGDSKSPPDWKYKDAIFLSLQDQTALAKRYSIVAEIPTKSYLRKMVGYLYAIERGAKYIYETDDDNSALDGLLGFKYAEYRGLEMNCAPSTMFVNPYAYYGQPSVWPRGYPLEMISENAVAFNCSKFTITSQLPLIQQGLVNGDPDVDAIYRLTRKQPSKLLSIEFDAKAPSLMLNKRQYAPTNSQNTFFHYDSFWTLIFPRNVTFREVDILRGYIAIRMLQEIDGRVSFLAPNAVQIRNAHSYHKDYLQETRLYESIYRFVADLDEWVCKNDETLKDCFIECIQMLVSKNHLSESEVNFYRLWIDDLDAIGYKWPSINSNPKSRLKEENFSKSIYFKALEQEHSSNSNDNEKSVVQRRDEERKLDYVKKACKFASDKSIDTNSAAKVSDLILVTWVKTRDDVDLITNVYNIHFKFIVACFHAKIENLDIVSEFLITNSTGGLTFIDTDSFKKCVYNAINVGFKQNSFILTKSLSMFEFWKSDVQLKEPASEEKLKYFDLNNKDEELYNKNNYFIRKTVANGQRILTIPSSNKTSATFNLDSYCSILTTDEMFKEAVRPVESALSSLNWHSNDLVGESCSNMAARTIWIPDFHDGPRVDLSSTLVHLGQKPVLGGFKGDASPYKSALKLAKVSSQVSEFVKAYRSVAKRELKETSVRENYNYYKTSTDFQSVDAVVCSFIAPMCEAFIPLNKTLIFNPAHRYNIGRCNSQSWTRLNENYYKLKSKSKLVVSAMSRYDEEYQAHFTGLRGYKLYAHGTFYGKNIQYNPIKSDILVGPTHGFGREGSTWLQEIIKAGKPKGVVFKTIRNLYPRYDLSDLAQHPAIVIFPYATMSYSIVDFYLSNLPIFVPSIDILTSSKSVYDRSIYMNSYCGLFQPIEPHKNSKHGKHDPNSDDSDVDYKYWLQYADYYQWPFVTVFDSWEDLIVKLQTLDLKKISDSMKEFNKIKQAYALDNWCRIIKSIPKDQPIPNNFEEGLSYFDMKSVQIY